MNKILKFLLKFIATIIMIVIIYETFNKDMDLFNWYMGALFEIIYLKWIG